jgi:hypothetical protein
MTCIPCSLLWQFVLNCLNLFDHTLNCLSLGDADETVSARVARARRAGRGWAVMVCKFLSTMTRWVTFGKVDHDHCDYALDKNIRPNSREIFSLTHMRFNWPPISMVEVTDIEDNGVRYTLIRHRDPTGRMPSEQQAIAVLQNKVR